jgi:hypothetical protein
VQGERPTYARRVEETYAKKNLKIFALVDKFPCRDKKLEIFPYGIQNKEIFP